MYLVQSHAYYIGIWGPVGIIFHGSKVILNVHQGLRVTMRILFIDTQHRGKCLSVRVIYRQTKAHSDHQRKNFQFLFPDNGILGSLPSVWRAAVGGRSFPGTNVLIRKIKRYEMQEVEKETKQHSAFLVRSLFLSKGKGRGCNLGVLLLLYLICYRLLKYFQSKFAIQGIKHESFTGYHPPNFTSNWML